MNNPCKIFGVLLLGLSIVISSCKKDVEGCTDSIAMNYSLDATSENGTCVYAHDIAQGTWFFDADCEDIPEGFEFIEDILPNSVEIDGNDDGILSLTILDTITVYGSIRSVDSIIVEQQTLFSFDTTIILPITVEFKVSGSGRIFSEDSGEMKLDYTAEPNLPIPGFDMSFSCGVELSREEVIGEE